MVSAIAEPVHVAKTHVKERCKVEDTSENNQKRDGTRIKIASPPEGTGLFRDPLEVLGNAYRLCSLVYIIR
jgi:hypothetical protein